MSVRYRVALVPDELPLAPLPAFAHEILESGWFARADAMARLSPKRQKMLAAAYALVDVELGPEPAPEPEVVETETETEKSQ